MLTSIVVSSLAAVGAALLLDQLAHITTHHPLFLSFASVGDAAGLDAAAAAAAATPTTAAVDAAGSEASAAFDTVAGADAAATAAAGAADDAGLEGLDLAGGMMTGGLSIEDMFWQILAADVCVRLFFTALKAMVALVPWPLLAWRPTGLALLSPRLSVPLSRWWLSSMFGKGSSHGKKPAHHYHHQVHPSMSGRASADMEGLLAEVEMASSSGSGSGSGSGSHHGARTHSPARSLGSSSSQQARRVQVSRCDRTSVYTRKRRIYTLLEAISLVVRSVLPIPAWFAYYAADKAYGDVFVWMYLTFKCMGR